jgi:drug/metabolite transporter (DMT)-like permease
LHSHTGLGVCLTLVAMFCLAAMDGVSKVLASALAIPQILWVRYILFTALAVLVLQRQGLAEVWRSGRPWLQTFRALIQLVENGVFVLAFTYLPLADVHAIAAASPLIVIAMSVPLLGEQVGIRRWLAVAAGFIGVLLIVRPGFQEIGLPILIALSGAVLWGLYQILVRLCAKTDSSDTTWLWSAVVGLAATSLVGPFVWIGPDAAGWIMLIAIALLGSCAHLALIKALSLAEASALQPYAYTLLLWAAVIGAVAFGDIPDGWTLSGAALILASGLYAWHRERLRAGAG